MLNRLSLYWYTLLIMFAYVLLMNVNGYVYILYTTNHQHTEWITKMIQKEILKHMQLANQTDV